LREFPELRKPLKQIQQSQENVDAAKQAADAAESLRKKAFEKQEKITGKEIDVVSVGREAEKARLAELMAEKRPRAEAAGRRLSGQAKEAQAVLTAKQGAADAYDSFVQQLSAKSPKDAYNLADTVINKLRSDGYISGSQQKQFLDEVSKVKRMYGEAAEAKQGLQLALRKVLVYSGYGPGGVLGYYTLRGLGI
jgi:hypothetical protein